MIHTIDLENIVNGTFTFNPLVVPISSYTSWEDMPYTYSGSTWTELVPNVFTNNALTVTATTI